MSANSAIPPTSPAKKLLVDMFFLCVFQPIVSLYDLISQPIFYFKDKVYERHHNTEGTIYSEQVNRNDPNSPWHQVHIAPMHREVEKDIDNMKDFAEFQQTCLKRHAKDRCFGYRQVLHEQWVKVGDTDKLQKQVKLSDYKWITAGQMDEIVEATRRGFLLAGIKAGDTVMVYADTKPEWQIVSQALVRLGAIVGTMFATLGVDGIVHSVNETQVTHLITQRDKVSKLLRLKSRLPKLTKIIYFDNSLDVPVSLGGDVARNGDEKHPDGVPVGTDESGSEIVSEFETQDLGVECVPFRQLVLKGLNANEAEIEQHDRRDQALLAATNKESIAVIMYTSGSTGIPKGVLIPHGAIMSTVKAFSYVTKDFCQDPKNNVGTAYLPLAHIFEFSLEATFLYHGVAFGFGTPHTLTDKSPGLQTGEKGDFVLLKPTITIIVPLILDRVFQGVKQVTAQAPYFKGKLINYLIEYKKYWLEKHYDTPLVDKIVCSKIAASLGGRITYCISGSAPLSSETQRFCRAAMNMHLIQGFGSTETCAAATCQNFDDMTTGNVGVPVAGTLIKLEPWLEGNYAPTDKPNPRGEIVIGGGVVAAGYYKLDQQTKESFYTDAQGIRWYRTGDIGEFLPNGNLKIIDRKKDLVKLQNGEFISYGRIESSLKSNQYTDNFCVYANSNYNYVVALGPANQASLRKLAHELIQNHDQEKFNEEDEDAAAADDDAARNACGDDHDKQQRQALVRNKSQQQRSNSNNNNNINHNDNNSKQKFKKESISDNHAIDELRGILNEYDDDPYADSMQISERKMSTLSSHSVANYDERLKRLCDNKLIREYVLSQISQLGRDRNLTSLEIPRKILLLAEDWTEDKNLVTGALKIRRNYIYKRYEEELKQIYQP